MNQEISLGFLTTHSFFAKLKGSSCKGFKFHGNRSSSPRTQTIIKHKTNVEQQTLSRRIKFRWQSFHNQWSSSLIPIHPQNTKKYTPQGKRSKPNWQSPEEENKTIAKNRELANAKNIRWRKRNFTRFVFQMTFNAQNSENPWTLFDEINNKKKKNCKNFCKMCFQFQSGICFLFGLIIYPELWAETRISFRFKLLLA